MHRFPTVEALAEATEEQVLSEWQGLGYYRRVRMLHAGAKQIVASSMPTSALDWRKVSGVGRYTAGAIASICFDEAVPVVDGNVERVYARVNGDFRTGAQLHSAAWQWADRVLDRMRPGDWNQALMELGATICTPKLPRCVDCPAKTSCLARRSGTVEWLPAPKARPASKNLEVSILIQRFADGTVGVRQFLDSEWWTGTWGFPIEPGFEHAGDELGFVKHAVTNHSIRARVVVTEPRSDGMRRVWESELAQLPMSSLMRKALRLLKKTNLADLKK